MKEHGKLHTFLSLLHTLSVWFLIFMLGAMVVRYKLPGAHSLHNGFTAAEAWIKALDESESERKFSEEIRGHMEKDAQEMLDSATVKTTGTGPTQNYALVTMGLLPNPVLLDMNGKEVHRWNIDTVKVWGAVSCTNVLRHSTHFADTLHLFPNGDILAQYADHGSPYGCGILRADKDGNVIWSYNGLVHHDFAVDEKGQVYTLLQDTAADPIPGYEKFSYPLTIDSIAQLSVDGKEMMRISILEAFKDTPYMLMLFRGTGDRDDTYDLLHTNAIDVLTPDKAAAFPQFEVGDILISSRATNILAVISPKTKKVKWAYQGFWRFQHAAQFLADGNILLLDNQGHVEGDETQSRALEFNPRTLGIEWSFVGGRDGTFLTEKVGRLQRLGNGNTLLVDSQHVRLLEVTPKGEIVWEYQMKKKREEKDYADAIYHAHLYTKEELPFMQEAK